MSKPELISTRVEPELAERIKSEAEKDRRTISQFVRNTLADALAEPKSRTEAGATA
jgi:hypothetical protein